MPYSRHYIPGDRLVECDRCGFGWRRSQMRRETSKDSKGIIVCPRCFDGPHPNDAVVPNKPEGRLEKI